MNALIPHKLTDVVETGRGMGNLKHMIYYKMLSYRRETALQGAL